VKHLSGAPLLGRPLASPANIRLGIRLERLARDKHSVNYDRKSFIIQAPG